MAHAARRRRRFRRKSPRCARAARAPCSGGRARRAVAGSARRPPRLPAARACRRRPPRRRSPREAARARVALDTAGRHGRRSKPVAAGGAMYGRATRGMLAPRARELGVCVKRTEVCARARGCAFAVSAWTPMRMRLSSRAVMSPPLSPLREASCSVPTSSVRTGTRYMAELPNGREARAASCGPPTDASGSMGPEAAPQSARAGAESLHSRIAAGAEDVAVRQAREPPVRGERVDGTLHWLDELRPPVQQTSGAESKLRVS
eukprot:3384124-Prymnesium_polylepis.2